MTEAPADVRGFEFVWDEICNIGGWLTHTEAFALYREAVRTPKDGLIVELGAYRGKSTALLAMSGREVTTVDPMTPGNYPSEQMQVTHIDARELSARVAKYPNVTWRRQNSTDFIPTRAVSLLYVDGKHSDDQPWWDWFHYSKFMLPGSRVAFHDYTTRVEVRDAVLSAESLGQISRVGVYQSLYVGQVK